MDADTPSLHREAALPRVGDRLIIPSSGLPRILESIASPGFKLIGPVVRDGAITYDQLHNADDLPRGWTDEQSPGRYRLKRRADDAFFGFSVGPNSWKRFLHVPAVTLWRARREPSDEWFDVPGNGTAPLALIGVRACELAAVAILDRVLLGGAHVDPHYARRRAGLFIVAVNCGQAGGTCFCASMGTGPRVSGGFDLAMTEMVTPTSHEFLVEVGTEAGAEVLQSVPRGIATDDQCALGEEIVNRTARQMPRSLDTTGIGELLSRNLEHPRWERTARRCLACANCTMVCPTCFCTTVEDVTDLAGMEAQRVRRWDSCFTTSFTYIHGGSIRPSIRSRYRQWLTHKLGTWADQFGTLGCVGCGRCITWCPVGIDLTEEVQAIRDSEPPAEDPKEQ